MTPDVVVDIGNSRMKWGLCRPSVAAEDMVSVPLDAPDKWVEQASSWNIKPKAAWAIGGVVPNRVETFGEWVAARGGSAVFFQKPSQLPITLAVDEPDKVGIDRVFGAIAAKASKPAGVPAITVDVGTAVTVNLVDANGVFQGGSIFPGPRLMALALHEHTAKLPLVELEAMESVGPPGKNTISAIKTGIFGALIGGIWGEVGCMSELCKPLPWLFVTGGGAEFLVGPAGNAVARLIHAPALNLEGIRLAAEALP